MLKMQLCFGNKTIDRSSDNLDRIWSRVCCDVCKRTHIPRDPRSSLLLQEGWIETLRSGDRPQYLTKDGDGTIFVEKDVKSMTEEFTRLDARRSKRRIRASKTFKISTKVETKIETKLVMLDGDDLFCEISSQNTLDLYTNRASLLLLGRLTSCIVHDSPDRVTSSIFFCRSNVVLLIVCVDMSVAISFRDWIARHESSCLANDTTYHGTFERLYKDSKYILDNVDFEASRRSFRCTTLKGECFAFRVHPNGRLIVSLDGKRLCDKAFRKHVFFGSATGSYEPGFEEHGILLIFGSSRIEVSSIHVKKIVKIFTEIRADKHLPNIPRSWEIQCDYTTSSCSILLSRKRWKRIGVKSYFIKRQIKMSPNRFQDEALIIRDGDLDKWIREENNEHLRLSDIELEDLFRCDLPDDLIVASSKHLRIPREAGVAPVRRKHCVQKLVLHVRILSTKKSIDCCDTLFGGEYAYLTLKRCRNGINAWTSRMSATMRRRVKFCTLICSELIAGQDRLHSNGFLEYGAILEFKNNKKIIVDFENRNDLLLVSSFVIRHGFDEMLIKSRIGLRYLRYLDEGVSFRRKRRRGYKMKISDIIIPDTREKLGAMSLNSLRRLCLSLKLDFNIKKKAQLIERLCNQLHIVQDDEEDTQTECQDEENRSDRSSFKSLPVGRSTGRKKRKRKPNKEKSKKRKKPNKEKSKTKKRKKPDRQGGSSMDVDESNINDGRENTSSQNEKKRRSWEIP